MLDVTQIIFKPCGKISLTVVLLLWQKDLRRPHHLTQQQKEAVHFSLENWYLCASEETPEVAKEGCCDKIYISSDQYTSSTRTKVEVCEKPWGKQDLVGHLQIPGRFMLPSALNQAGSSGCFEHSWYPSLVLSGSWQLKNLNDPNGKYIAKA